jgi:hypothetical protein
MIAATMGTLLFASSAQAASTAVAQQGQGQSQNQATMSAATVSQSGNSAVSFTDSFNGSEPIRGLPLPSGVTVDTRGGPAMFSRPEADKGPNFISAVDLIALLNNAVAEDMEYDEGALKIGVQMLNEEDANAAEGKPLHFSLVGKGGAYGQAFKPVAILTLEAEDEVNSAVLAAGLAHKAKELGCSEITFIREGVVRELTSTGYGIGLSYNYATVGSGTNGYGGVGAGGTGWSHGSARYLSFPYMTAVCGN